MPDDVPLRPPRAGDVPPRSPGAAPVAIIMAGGRGQRFWPLSTEAKPKQFLDLERCGGSLLQSTFDRVVPLVDTPDRVLVATGARYEALVRDPIAVKRGRDPRRGGACRLGGGVDSVEGVVPGALGRHTLYAREAGFRAYGRRFRR